MSTHEEIMRHRKLAETGDAAAQNNLGWMYQNGKGVPQDDAEAVKWYLKAAEQGNAAAQNNLGWMYRNGKGVPQDDAEAVKWYLKAAEQGNAAAQNNLGWMYRNGKGVPQDDAEAVKWYLKAAEQGNAEAKKNIDKAAEQGNADAQFWLGWMYQTGKGVPQNDTEAVKWFHKAAEQGNADAQNWLGWMYRNGKGVPQDDAEAVKWYRKAAEQGNADAQNCMGWMYQNGKGVWQNDTEAVKWYRKAAEQGSTGAQNNLGAMYRNGKGVPQDDAEAVKWFRKAAEQGDADAQNWMGWMCRNGKGVPQDDTEAVKWYRKAAEQGNAAAQNNLGWMHQNGKGVPQDDAQAVRWYLKAAEQGNAQPQFWIGWMYQKGKGIPRDDAEAVKWFRKAAEQGNADAQNWLGWMYENGKGVPQNDTEALKWYRKAAGQGNADAQNNLVRMKAKGIKADKAESKPLSEQTIAVTPSSPKNEKSSAVVRDLRNDRECKALLDACTPLIYVHNAFRISGIPVDASTPDTQRRIDDLKAAAETNDLQNELIHAFALDPAPSLDQIREAKQRLQDPERRIIDEFFWFWPTDWPNEWGKSDIDPALTALRKCDKETASKVWSEVLSDNHSPRSTVAKHNLAVMYHLKALDSEQNALKSDLSAEQLVTISTDWRTCFKWWEELADDETLWSSVADRIRKVDDPRLTTGFARRLRATLPEAMHTINARLAIDFAKRGKSSAAENHINYMKETHQGKDNIQRILSCEIQPFKARVTSAVEKATSIANKQPAQAAKEALDLLEAISEPLKVIQTILPLEDHERIDFCNNVVEACITCQLAYARETEDWTTSLEILDKASKYAASKETKEPLAEHRAKVLISKHLAPLLEKIKKIELHHSIDDKMRIVENEILPDLRTIRHLSDMSEDVYDKCADAVASRVREISVSEYNKNSNLKAALRILDVSISVACGREVRDKLQKDKAQLINIQTEITKHNLHMQIRSDDIEVTNEFVRYNNQKVLVSSIQGIKYGVFAQYTNGIKTSSSYLIDIAGGQSGNIHIECKRFFRKEGQAELDFNRILEALYHQVIPSLVQRFAERIVAGQPFQVGDCRLTTEGMYITTGSLLWKKETSVPFSDLQLRNYQGHLYASSAKDKKIKASMVFRDTWNAVFLEHIVKAVVQSMTER